MGTLSENPMARIVDRVRPAAESCSDTNRTGSARHVGNISGSLQADPVMTGSRMIV
jgi:hypothetical protein